MWHIAGQIWMVDFRYLNSSLVTSPTAPFTFSTDIYNGNQQLWSVKVCGLNLVIPCVWQLHFTVQLSSVSKSTVGSQHQPLTKCQNLIVNHRLPWHLCWITEWKTNRRVLTHTSWLLQSLKSLRGREIAGLEWTGRGCLLSRYAHWTHRSAICSKHTRTQTWSWSYCSAEHTL